jgi:hypothetical protein
MKPLEGSHTVELIIALALLILIGLSGALAGADSRDGSDWHRR